MPVLLLPLPLLPEPVLPEPVLPEPVLPEPVLPEPVPVTCSPTVRLTGATVPEMVDVSEASLSAVWALDSDDSAEVTAAWSESIWVVVAPAASSAADGPRPKRVRPGLR